MPAPNAVQQIQEVPLKIVGGNKFGRYPKISDEETINFIVSDDFLVPYAGYGLAGTTTNTLMGRGNFSSFTGQFMLNVIGNKIYKAEYNSVLQNLIVTEIPNATLSTTSGDVYLAENNNRQIAIVDGVNLYVYDYGSTPGFYSTGATGASQISWNFTVFPNPSYVAFQNGRFIVTCNSTQYWVLSKLNQALDQAGPVYAWPQNNSSAYASQVGVISSKPCKIRAAVPVPGGGNNLLVLGSNVSESWQDVGYATFPYQRNSTFNVDFGCLNPSSIAALDNYIVFLAVNEQAGPFIIVIQGGNAQRISTDGIDYKLSQLKNPENCTGFLFRQDGHLIYQFTFIEDNLSFAYDFNTGLFFTVTDDNLNYHPARQVVFFNNEYYFVSINDPNIYRFGTQYTCAQYGFPNDIASYRELPRIRITPPVRLPTQRYFIAKSLGFTIENGQQNDMQVIPLQPYIYNIIQTEALVDITTENGQGIGTELPSVPSGYETFYSEAVDLSISRDGGETFGSRWRLNMNKTGKRKSRFIWQRLGIVNDATFQLQFSGFGRFVATDGVLEIYQ